MDRACDHCGSQLHAVYEYNGEMLCAVCIDIIETADDKDEEARYQAYLDAWAEKDK